MGYPPPQQPMPYSIPQQQPPYPVGMPHPMPQPDRKCS